MKNKLVLLSVSLFLLNVGNAQKLKELKNKVKTKVSEATGGDLVVETSLEIDKKSQLEILKENWEDKKMAMYVKRATYTGKAKTTRSNCDFKLFKNANGKVVGFSLDNDAGYDLEYLAITPEGTDYVTHFSRKDDMHHASIIGNSLVFYQGYMTAEKDDFYFKKNSYKIVGGSIELKKADELVKEQRMVAQEQLNAARQALIDAELAKRKKYTLEGKTITKISPIWIDKEPNGGIIAGNLYSIGLEVTFADGTKDKTINAGGNLYNCDFTAISTTAQITDFDSDYEMNSKGKYIGDVSRLSVLTQTLNKTDKISVKISNKFGGTYAYTLELPIIYPKENTIFNGGGDAMGGTISGQGGGRGGHGMSIEVQLTAKKHAVTGTKYYMYKVTNTVTKGVKYGRFTGGKLDIDASGGKGGSGARGYESTSSSSKPGRGGAGGNGGNGGNVIVKVDPSAKNVIINVDVSGGTKGYGGRGGRCSFDCPYSDGADGPNGSDGKKGTFKIVNTPVKL